MADKQKIKQAAQGAREMLKQIVQPSPKTNRK
jgi:hypothetical protein